jgi:hypothetical protein
MLQLGNILIRRYFPFGEDTMRIQMPGGPTLQAREMPRQSRNVRSHPHKSFPVIFRCGNSRPISCLPSVNNWTFAARYVFPLIALVPSHQYLFSQQAIEIKDMGLVKRQAGDRRWGMSVEFPLTDNLGNRIIHDRRSGGQRRRSIATLEDLIVLFSQLPSVDPEQQR